MKAKPVKNNRPQGAMAACLTLVFSLYVGSSFLHAANVTWDAGESPVTNWITAGFQNWSGDTNPVGNDIVFGATGATASSSTITNTVNQNTSITSLLYQYDSATNYQVTEINTGVTLSVGGATNVFTVGNYLEAAKRITNTVFTGAGTLAISQTGGTVFIGSNNTTAITGMQLANRSIVDLNMRGLAVFDANLGSTGVFNIGGSNGTDTYQGSHALMTLADTNTITAGTLSVGSSTGAYHLTDWGTAGAQPSSLFLGRDNTINADTIKVGYAGATSNVSGLIQFDSSVLASNPNVIIRGSNGTGTVTNFYVGYSLVGSGDQYGAVDFSGGEVDAQVTNLLVGNGRNSSNKGRSAGTLTMNQGTFTVTGNNFIGGANANNTNTSFVNTGILNVGGGVFNTASLVLANSAVTSADSAGLASGTLNISGTGAVAVTGVTGLVMGKHANMNNTGLLSATINLTGGSLTVSGAIAEGVGPASITSTINLSGGTLEMNGNAITVDTLNVESGTLRNLSQLNSGGTLTKTTAGTLIVEGTNTYTGTTDINVGTLLVNGMHTGGGAYTINSGGTLGGTGTITTAGNAGVVLASGGKLSPGASAGELKLDLGTGVLNISAGITASDSQSLNFELGTSSDRITLTNAGSTLDIGSGLLEFDDFVFATIGGFSPGTYTLFDTGNTISGVLGSTLTGTLGGYAATIQFSPDNQDLLLNVIPEPSAVALLCLAGGMLWMLTRRRGSKLA